MTASDYLYPLVFKPVYKDYIWGGTRIPKLYNRAEPDGIYAESWEISTRPEGMSIVSNGHLAGRTLQELIDEFGDKLLGDSGDARTFPLLIKIIDAARNLSVQVHPDDNTAPQVGGEAKTEAWYVLDAEPGATIYAGLKPGANPAVIRESAENGTMADYLTSIPAVKGDVIYVPGGRVHAIGAGCLLLEIQQNSNTTYRLYDWNRTGPDGKKRELHLEKALKVINWKDTSNAKQGKPAIKKTNLKNGNTITDLLKTPYFQIEKYALQSSMAFDETGDSFEILFVEEGSISIEHQEEVVLDAGPGVSILIPASILQYQVNSDTGARVLRITGPDTDK